MTWLSVGLEGYNALKTKLEAGELYHEPWRRMLERATASVYKRARDRAPYDKGDLYGSIKSELVGRPLPLYGKVSFPSLSRDWKGKQFRYGGALEGSKKYHYRATRHKGKPTRRWFRGALSGAKRAIDAYMKAAAQQIEVIWRRR